MHKFIIALLVVNFYFSVLAYAHGGHSSPEHVEHSQGETVTKVSPFSIFADLRPSVSAVGGSYFLDNEIGLGYAITPKTNLNYTQRFQVLLRNKDIEHEEEGPDFHEHHDGFFQLNVDEIAAIGSSEVSYETRIFTPTSELKRNRGFITALGNFFKIIVPVSSQFSICVSEGPVIHSFSKAEYNGADGIVSNPLLENRLVASFDANFFSQKLRVSLPISWHEFLHYSSSQGAKFSGSWSHAIWISPEITYKVAKDMQLGISYHSENLLKDFTYTVALQEGLQGGAFQMVYRMQI